MVRLPAAALALLLTAAAALAADPAGLWQTQDGDSRIRIAPCGAALCGTLAWLREPADAQGRPKLDAANGDPALRGRPLAGIPLISGMVRDGAGWRGKVYNPEDGKTYDATLALKDASTLLLQGCLAVVLCQTETLTRFEGR